MDNQNKASLHDAVLSGDVTKTYEILRRDASHVNSWNVYFKTPLQLVYDSVYFDDPVLSDDKLKIAKLLVDYGADLNARGFEYESPLYTAVETKQINGVEFLLKNGANPSIRSEFGRTALWLASIKDYQNVFDLLLDYKADPNIWRPFDDSPLNIAILSSRFNSARKLILSGAKSRNVYDDLLHACANCSGQSDKPKHMLFIEYLLRQAPKLDSHGNFSLGALLYYAVSKEHEKHHGNKKMCFLLELLKEQNLDFDDALGDSELHSAVRDGNELLVQDLLQKGADVEAKNAFDLTPLHLALEKRATCDEKRSERIATMLINYGSDLRAPNCLSETPFFLATKMHSAKLVNLMLAKISGVDEGTLRNSLSGEIPKLSMRKSKSDPELHEVTVASALDYEEVVDRLLDLDYVRKSSENPSEEVNLALKQATKRSRCGIVRILLEADFRCDGRFTDDLPRFSMENSHDNNLKTLCLFWEFQDSVVVERAIVDAVYEVVVNQSFVNKFMKLVISYYAMYLRKNTRLSPDLDRARGLFELDNELAEVFSKCNQKLDELKEMKIGDIPIYSIITMKFDSFVQLLDNENHLGAIAQYRASLRKLEYYDYAVTCRIDLAMEKRKVFYAAGDCLNNAIEGILEAINFKSLPDKITYSILAHLNMRELRILAKTD